MCSLALALLHCAQKTDEKTIADIKQIGESEGIINGVAVSYTQDIGKSTVALYFLVGGPNNTGKVASFCTGTLIAKNIVLSAAHCFADASESLGVSVEEFARYVRVGFGLTVASNISDPNVEFHKLKAVKIHPEYTANSVDTATSKPMDDLSLIKFEGNAPATARTAKLVEDSSILKKGTKIILAGFGLVDAFNQTMAKRLMYTTVNIFNPAITPAQFTYVVKGGRSACSGDSGGPAYLPSKNGEINLVGVTSWGDNYCEELGAYTSVPRFASWIQQSVSAL